MVDGQLVLARANPTFPFNGMKELLPRLRKAKKEQIQSLVGPPEPARPFISACCALCIPSLTDTYEKMVTRRSNRPKLT